MKKYRSAALVLASCAASLSVAACSAGSSTAGSSTANPATASPAAPGSSVSAPASSAGPAIPGRTITVKGTLGTFPVPAGAKVVENTGGGKAIVIVFGLIAPADVSRFYATALPQAGYSVTTNSMLNKADDQGALIQFTGHGYKGTIDSLVQFPGVSVAGLGDKNVTTIIVSQK